jgi:hypothetical protein
MNRSFVPRYFLLLFAVCCSFVLKAQDANPFQSIGKKAKVHTLSKGKYVEVFENDSIRQVGCVLINIKTQTIVGFLNEDSLQHVSADNSQQSRWYQQDPLMEEYYEYSPYNYALNNPVNFTDPDGMKVVKNGNSITIDGDDISTYFGYIQTIAEGNGSIDNLYAGLDAAAGKDDGSGGAMSGTLRGVTSYGEAGGLTFNVPGAQGDADFFKNSLYAQPVREPYTGFGGLMNHIWTGGVDHGYKFNLNGVAIGRAPSMGVPPDAAIGEEGNINAVYKGIKNGLPYIGKSFNILKRYTTLERVSLKIKSMFPNINDPKLLRAIEQVVLDYQRSLGPVSNVNEAMDLGAAKNAGWYQKGLDYLETNIPNWRKIVSETLKK